MTEDARRAFVGPAVVNRARRVVLVGLGAAVLAYPRCVRVTRCVG